MRKTTLILILILVCKESFCQDSRKIFVGKYSGVQKQTNVPGSTFYDYGASAKVTLGDSLSQKVFFYDSCSWAPNWTGAPGNFQAWPDSTIRAMGNSSVIYGKLYANDSLYFQYVLTGGPSTTTEEFFGFKIKTGVGINEIKASDISVKIWPNPVNEKLFLKSADGKEILKLILTDVNGKEIPLQQSGKEEFNLSVLPEGLYFLKIQTTEGILTKKIVIQH